MLQSPHIGVKQEQPSDSSDDSSEYGEAGHP